MVGGENRGDGTITMNIAKSTRQFSTWFRGVFRVLVNIVVVLVVVGLLLWLINTYIPMAASIKSLLNIVVFVVVLVWVLRIFGVLGNIPGVHIPNLN